MKWWYYLLQFTWGILINLFGAIAYLILAICFGFPSHKYRNMYCVAIPWNFGGLNLGVFAIYGKDCPQVLSHEYGHSIQNLWWGPFTLLVIALPSAIRYWYREIKTSLNKPLRTAYDDIWFEGQATALGKKADADTWTWL